MARNDRKKGGASKQPRKAPTGRAHKGNHSPKRQAGDRQDMTGLPFSRRDSYFLHGRHAVAAALANQSRTCLALFATEKTMSLARELSAERPELKISSTHPARMDITAGPDTPHQGIMLEVLPLSGADIHDLRPWEGQRNIILMLDQVTDPHNIGACLRSAAAFGARAVITQDRNSPGETGVLARAAQGGLESVPWIQVTNLASALETLKEAGYWHAGMDGHTDTSIRDLDLGENVVLVMGSEGKGLRPLVAKHCDALVKIPMNPAMESLNVSNAAAIALYELAAL